MVIQHNLAALNNLNVGNRVQKAKFKATERLASGHRINRAADDAAGLAISEKMRARMRALFQVQNNIEDGISLTQTADGALAEVNDMLNRVQELCVQAANGTNTDEDRIMLADEITQLYDAMEAVFTDTEFNTMKIFRHDGANFYAGRPRYNYTETVNWLPEGEYASWGEELLGIKDKTFETSKNAVAATATVVLDDSVNVSDATTLVGKNLQIGNCNYQFVNSANGDTCGYKNTVNGQLYFDVDTKNKSVQEVFDYIKNNYYNSYYSAYNSMGKIESVSVTTSAGKSALKLVMQKTDLTPSCTIDGTTIQYPSIVGGNGSFGNGVVISSKEGRPLEEVDSAGNVISFASSANVSFTLLSGSNILTPEEIESFQKNRFYIRIGSEEFDIPVGDLIKDNNTMTREDARKKFVEALYEENFVKNLQNSGYQVTGAVSGDKVLMTLTSNQASEMLNVYIDDEPKDSVDIASGTSKSMSFVWGKVSETTPESVEVWSLTIPDTEDSDFPLTCSFETENGPRTLTVFYRAGLNGQGANGATADNGGIVVYVDRPDKNAVLTQLSSYISSYLTDTVVTKNGDTLTIKGKTANTELKLNERVVGSSVNYTSQKQYKNITYSNYFVQEYSMSLDLNERMSSVSDKTALYGTGFCLNGVSYEFSDASSDLSNEDTLRIDISGCGSYAAIAEKTEKIIASKEGTEKYKVTDSSGILTITGKKTTYNSSLSPDTFSDGKAGADGLLNNEAGIVSVKTSGGKNMSRPQTSIDFSGVNLDNISDLYGKGFRITCATCPGEFVNVIFCHDKTQANFPPSFEYTDENGNKNQIKNHVVELKNITSGNEIVDSIAQQLQGSMEHTITVEPDGAKLLVMDKRYGDILDKDDHNKVLQAKILAGVYTNCTYHVDAERIVDDSELVGDGRADTDAYYAFVMIYAGDTEENPYIPIHLPYLSLDHLKLDYPKDSFQTYEGVTKVMRRSKTAASVISMARSKIGADQNRLEHAFQYAANAEEQVTSSYSRIHDADMAEEAVNQARNNILAEVQQAMLLQISKQPEQVLSLLR